MIFIITLNYVILPKKKKKLHDSKFLMHSHPKNTREQPKGNKKTKFGAFCLDLTDEFMELSTGKIETWESNIQLDAKS